MIDYFITLKMADSSMPITNEMEELISQCAHEACLTTVSRKNKRTFSVEKRIDDYTLVIKLRSRDTIISPTRTMSTLTRAVIHNEKLYSLVKNHVVNGQIFNTALLNVQDAQIIHIPDTQIVSEIISIFFKKDYLPKEEGLVEETAAKIRKLIIEYKNRQSAL
ncbi:hypothetical protein [Acetatifactor aquisgranensis]|jgi:hypothetical protein|uniref:hypothetical protein n=1 Tax=Acetatifactor aquisgranensis TaxID=2941233 RepID=UPI002041DA4B|nr:hypothetical protein [Acetatifactor aquisgranensis]MCI8542877.1 hypothetical protein [Lachnospiraceae bacterium]